jgi:hypothetical protein
VLPDFFGVHASGPEAWGASVIVHGTAGTVGAVLVLLVVAALRKIFLPCAF